MEILFCHNQYQQCSGEDIAFDFAIRLLQEDGHRISVYSRNNRDIRDFNVADKLLFPFRTLYALGARSQVQRLAREQQPTVALVQNVFPLLSPSIYYGLAHAGLPIVQMVFNYRLMCLNGLFFTGGDICERCIRGNYLHGVLRRCYRESHVLSAIYATSIGVHRWIGTWRKLVTLFVTPDLFLKGKLVEGGIPAERIRVVSNPFDSSAWEPDYSLGSYALFVGRLIRAKGVFTLLEASRGLNGVRVVIVGDGEEVEGVRSHPAVREGRAEYVGAVYGDRFAELVQKAACVVVPSEWYDNLPMIVCQAFAMGKPVIASRINGIPEFVKHEENGLLFKPGSVTELRESIERLCGDADLHGRLSRDARRLAETVLSPRSWQESMNSVLNEAATIYSEARRP
jgi:glycosyltransferase involved in cell wall biosynthesis